MRILYYVILLPFSFLPNWILYRISDAMYVVLYKIIGYRKAVVRTNIENSFPDYTSKQQLDIERKFYSHFCDLITESIKAFSISKAELQKRFVHLNPELLTMYFEKNQNITLVGGHYGNWELYGISTALNMQPHPIALFKPLSNKFMNKKITKSRSKFGLQMKSYSQVKQILELGKEKQLSVIFAADQRPRLQQKPHWTTFLHQETGVQYGTEKFARDNNTPVIYGVIKKTKRGHYQVQYELLCEFPNELPLGAITELHTKALERDIREEPAFWLWTHRRWKQKRVDFDRYQEKMEAEKISA